MRDVCGDVCHDGRAERDGQEVHGTSEIASRRFHEGAVDDRRMSKHYLKDAETLTAGADVAWFSACGTLRRAWGTAVLPPRARAASAGHALAA
jgi:hypothetical protein